MLQFYISDMLHAIWIILPYSVQMLNQHLKNIKLQYCKCCINITKCKFNVAKTLQKLQCNIQKHSTF